MEIYGGRGKGMSNLQAVGVAAVAVVEIKG